MNLPWTEMCNDKESIWRLCALWNEEWHSTCVWFPLRSDQEADCLIFAAQLKRTEQTHGSRCGHTLQVNWYNGRALPGGSYKHMFPRRSFQELKSRAAERGQDKWLWKLVAQYRQWFSMVHKYINGLFFGKKKEKVWRPNSDVYGNISIHACVAQWCTGSLPRRFYVIS